jgi:hypothetical protein
MHVGVLPGDFTISVDESGKTEANLVLSTAYNVLPLWIRIAHDSLTQARFASEKVANNWGESDDSNKELLISELEPSLQVFVACGIALDALYDQLRPHAKLSEEELKKWRDCSTKTGRADHIAEVIRRVYKLDNEMFSKFKLHIKEIIKYRDLAVHPSLQLRNYCTRPDIPVGVDWKFSAYRFSNSEKCLTSTMRMLGHLYENKCGNEQVDKQLHNVFLALQELRVVTINA